MSKKEFIIATKDKKSEFWLIVVHTSFGKIKGGGIISIPKRDYKAKIDSKSTLHKKTMAQLKEMLSNNEKLVFDNLVVENPLRMYILAGDSYTSL